MDERNDGPRLAAARQAAGLSLDDVLFEMRSRLPTRMWVSRPTLSRWEKRSTLDPIFTIFLADLYGADIGADFPEAAEDASRY